MNIAGIFNFSGVELTEDEQRFLSRGLKYAPPRRLSKFYTFVDVQKYIRKINIKRYLISNPIKNRVEGAWLNTWSCLLSSRTLQLCRAFYSQKTPLSPPVWRKNSRGTRREQVQVTQEIWGTSSPDLWPRPSPGRTPRWPRFLYPLPALRQPWTLSHPQFIS